jgi:hypothetical protein
LFLIAIKFKIPGVGRKRKIDSECRVFKEQWNFDYFVLCLICCETILVMEQYNISRHYETKYVSKYGQFTGKLRADKLEAIKCCLSSQKNTYKKTTTKNEAATTASFRAAQLLAKAGKPFTDGLLIKS